MSKTHAATFNVTNAITEEENNLVEEDGQVYRINQQGLIDKAMTE